MCGDRVLDAELEGGVYGPAVEAGYRKLERERLGLDAACARLVDPPDEVADGGLGEKGSAGVIERVDGAAEALDLGPVLGPPLHLLVPTLASRLVVDFLDDMGGDGQRIVRHGLVWVR